MRSLWDLKTSAIREQTRRAPYGKKLALLGLITVTLLAGGTILALPMSDTNPNVQPEASISLKSSIDTQAKPAPTPALTVNGQAVSIPAGTTDQVMESDMGNVNIHTESSSSGSATNTSSNSLTIDVQGSGTVNAKSETTGGSSIVNILTR